jgi:metallo-beta-lactamase family protein
MRIRFFGAAGEVTGSCTLVETDSVRFLVDCGMFQGGAEARAKNNRALNFGFDVRDLDFVLLTHAHIDHSGLLPRLAVLGFRGPVYANPCQHRSARGAAAGQRPHPGKGSRVATAPPASAGP